MTDWIDDPEILAEVILPHFNFDMQLSAIRELLQCHRMRELALGDKITEINEQSKQASGSLSYQLAGEYVDACEHSVYLGSAHAMAAVGMLAPLAESLMLHAFLGIRDELHHSGRLLTADRQHVRWSKLQKKFWDCTHAAGSKGTLQGITELSKAIGLYPFIPERWWSLLAALFYYRNKMFHMGFEWPPSELDAFRGQIAERNWPSSWFDTAISGGQPRAFYLTDVFVEDCLNVVVQVHNALGLFVRANTSLKMNG